MSCGKRAVIVVEERIVTFNVLLDGTTKPTTNSTLNHGDLFTTFYEFYSNLGVS